MTDVYINSEPHAHSMQVKTCIRCRGYARNTVHYSTGCEYWCDDCRHLATDNQGQPVVWDG